MSSIGKDRFVILTKNFLVDQIKEVLSLHFHVNMSEETQRIVTPNIVGTREISAFQALTEATREDAVPSTKP